MPARAASRRRRRRGRGTHASTSAAPSIASTRPPGNTNMPAPNAAFVGAAEHEHLDAARPLRRASRRSITVAAGWIGTSAATNSVRSLIGARPYRRRSAIRRGAARVRWRMPTPSEAPNVAERRDRHLSPGTHLIVPLANGEPTAVLDAIEDAAAEPGVASTGWSSTRCTPSTTGRTSPVRSATGSPRLVLPVARDAPALRGRARSGWCRRTSPRCTS